MLWLVNFVLRSQKLICKRNIVLLNFFQVVNKFFVEVELWATIFSAKFRSLYGAATIGIFNVHLWAWKCHQDLFTFFSSNFRFSLLLLFLLFDFSCCCELYIDYIVNSTRDSKEKKKKKMVIMAIATTIIFTSNHTVNNEP